MRFTCDGCGNQFRPGNTPEGLPNGVGLVSKSGRTVHLCTTCVMLYPHSSTLRDKIDKIYNGDEV